MCISKAHTQKENYIPYTDQPLSCQGWEERQREEMWLLNAWERMSGFTGWGPGPCRTDR